MEFVICVLLVLLIAEIFLIAMYCLRKLEDRLNGIWLAIKHRLERIEEKTNDVSGQYQFIRNEIMTFFEKLDNAIEKTAGVKKDIADATEKKKQNKNIDLSKEVADMLEYAANVVKGSDDISDKRG